MNRKPEPSKQATSKEENQIRRAIALGYDPDKDPAPRILASGQGVLAEQIINLARANSVPIREDPVLTAALSNVALDEFIPPELYALVAEILAYIYRLQKGGE